MIYITGDTHSDFTRFTEDQFPIQSEMTKKDFDIDGKKFFTFGGAKSHDIQDGILNLDDKKWYFGHYHDYRQVNSQFVLLYEGIIPLEFELRFELKNTEQKV